MGPTLPSKNNRWRAACSWKAAIAGSAVLALTGCASFTSDGGMGPVSEAATAELAKDAKKISTADEASAARKGVQDLLSKPLTAESAVQMALLNNRGLQAEYNALGIAEAAYVEASLPPSPSFTLERIVTSADLEIERRLVANIFALLTLPARSEIARKEFEAARLKATEATFKLAADTRRAYFQAVASGQTVAYLEQARETADIAATLTRKLGETGAASKIDQARVAAFYAEVSNQLAEARIRKGTDREQLVRLMGLWSDGMNFRLPPRLPMAPDKLLPSTQLEADAIRKRVDLMAARLELDGLAKSLGLTEATRFVSALDLAGIAGYSKATGPGSEGKTYKRGFEVDIEIPVFDLGETGVRRARETYMQAVNRLADKAITIRSEVRTAYLRYRGTYEISRKYRDSVLPLRKTIDEQALLQYNGMLIDIFELLSTSRESIASNVAAISAKKDFFIASVDMHAALIGGGASGSSGEAAATLASAEGGGH